MRSRDAWIDVDHVLRALLAHALEAGDLLGGEVVEIGHVFHEALRHELVDERLAEVIDRHRRAAREVEDAALHLRRALAVRAAHRRFEPSGLPSSRTRETTRVPHTGHFFGISNGSVPGGRDRGLDGEHLRDDLAGLLDRHAIADAHVELADLVGVVERGARHGGAAELDGVHVRDGRERAGTADLNGDRAHAW